MTGWPTTRNTLIRALADQDNHQDWCEFYECYQPAIYRFGRRKGLSHDDSSELVQRVFISVHRSLTNWAKTEKPPFFRRWLMQVTTNALKNLFSRDLKKRSAGGTSNLRVISESAAQVEQDEGLWEEEKRRAVIRAACQKIKPEYSRESWLAFEQTSIQGVPVEEVAKQLKKSRVAIYASRARIIKRLRLEVSRMGGFSIE